MTMAQARTGAPNLLDWYAMLRPHHWPKCLVVLVGLLPTGAFRDPRAILGCLAAAGLFQAIASAGYIINDLLDLRRDRLHPIKRQRPIASGRIPPAAAFAVATVLAAGALATAALLSHQLLLVLGVYLCITVLYSIWFKHAVGADILTIAVIFVLRAIAGLVVIDAFISPWFLLSIGSLALLLALGKRMGELSVLTHTTMIHRVTLRRYRASQWRLVLWGMGAVAIGCYAMATMASPTGISHRWLWLTVLPVTYGIWHYLGIVQGGSGSEQPERLVLRDPRLLGAAVVWAGLFAIAIVVGAGGGR